MGSTLMACSGPRAQLDEAMTTPLTTGATWSIADGELTIRGAGITLVLRRRDAVFPTRNATPLVEGELGDAVYRLSWRADNGFASVDWESREAPGSGFSSSGLGRPVDYDVPDLDPTGVQVPGKAFVYVPAPRAVARVAWVTAAGEQVDLTSYDIPPAKTWRIYAGFVGSVSKGGRAISYDAAGHELMRSRALPY